VKDDLHVEMNKVVSVEEELVNAEEMVHMDLLVLICIQGKICMMLQRIVQMHVGGGGQNMVGWIPQD